MAEFASNAKGNTGVTLGAIGTGLGILNGGLGNILGGNMWNNGNCSENTLVTRYENGLQQTIAAKDSEIGLLKSNIYTDQKIADVFERLNTRLVAMDKENCERFAAQATYNATLNGAVANIQNQVTQLQGLTKLIVPNSSICPGWGEAKVCVIPCNPQPTSSTTPTK